MASKKSFLLRVDPGMYEALEKWSADELRSVNAHIEYLLRDALKRAGRLPRPIAMENAVQRSNEASEDAPSE
ncbi:MAG TPA: hypothetical protein VN426_09020 [Syntrophomonadaceae bacterium]|nr:hypothetical protein [Syntrophomonadaceae bacterium]